MGLVFFFQAEDGIRDGRVTGVQTCALPISGLDGGGGRVHRSGVPGGHGRGGRARVRPAGLAHLEAAGMTAEARATWTGERAPGLQVRTAGRPVVELRHVSKWYGDVVAVSDLSFELWPGVTGLLGPNGAGKTTTLKAICGLLRPSQGEVLVFGRSLAADPVLYRAIGVVPDGDRL